MPKFLVRPAAEAYGYAIGIIHTGKAGAPGDLRNPSSYSYPVLFRSLPAAEAEDADALIEVAKDLAACGVRAIAGSGGAMLRHQKSVAAAVDIPVCLSPVVGAPIVAMTGARSSRLCIVTSQPADRMADILSTAGIHCAAPLEVVSLEGGGLGPEIAARLAGARAVILDVEDAGMLLPEVRQALDVPIFDMVTLVDYLHDAVLQRTYRGFF